MGWKDLKNNTGELLLIDKSTLRNLESNEDALNQNIKYWLKTGKLISLKKGLYILREKWEKEQDKDDFLEYIANRLLGPSYVSLEYVLAKYGLLTEAPTTVTSVTVKTGRSFNNELAGFNYYSISETLFTGYEVKDFQGAFVNVAKKEKALFDFLYFRFLDKEPNREKMEGLRINWENISRKEIKKAADFCGLTDNKNIKKVFEVVDSQF